MNPFAAALLLAVALSGAKKFPHTGDPCKDACGMTRMACEDDCQKQAKHGGDSKACFKDCDDQVADCARTCPAAMQQARKQMKEQGIPEPQNQGR